LSRELLIAVGPGEWRAAWIEDGTAVELHVERGDIRPAGSIHLGRVVRLVAGLDAALVDIGEARPGFLPIPGAIRGAIPDEGARIVVQVRREMQRGKGALLSTRLQGEAAFGLADRAARAEPPCQLAPAAGFAATLQHRLPGVPDRIFVDETAPLAELRAVFPQTETVRLAADAWPLDVDAAFEAALAPSIGLPGGGRMHLEESRAAALIDIDTGSPEAGSADRTIAAANREAVGAIAREIRLRQLGGGIIIDFAGLEGRGPRERIREQIAAAFARDPARPQVLGWTRLGHLEIVRPRRGRSVADAMLEPGLPHKSATTLAFEALRMVMREARANPAADWRIATLPSIGAVLRGQAAPAFGELETRLGRRIAIATVADPGVHPFDIVAV
jgi:ribonuclease G